MDVVWDTSPRFRRYRCKRHITGHSLNRIGIVSEALSEHSTQEGMTMGWSWLSVLLFLVASCTPAFGEDAACEYFYEKLVGLPHSNLILKRGVFDSLLDGKPVSGCEVEFKTHASMVPGEKVFERFESLTHAPGWVADPVADGPGTSTVVVEREKNRCFLHWSQNSWVDEESKEIKQSEDIEVKIQCLSK